MIVTSRLWQTNAVVWNADDVSMLIDSPVLPDELAWLPELLGGQPDLLITTHGHFDHMLAPTAFPDLPLHAGVETLRALANGAGDLAHAQLRATDAEWYVSERVPLQLDGLRELPALEGVTVVEAGGHAADGIALLFEEDGLLVAGDYLCEVEIPLVSAAGSPDGYAATLERLEPLIRAAEEVVPGHGPPLTRDRALALLESDLRYVTAIREGGPQLRGPWTERQGEIHKANLRKHGDGG